MDEVFLTATEQPTERAELGKIRHTPSDHYEIVGSEGDWHVAYGAEQSMPYATKEAAFEAIIGAAANAIRGGHEVTIRIPGASGGESTLGASSRS